MRDEPTGSGTNARQASWRWHEIGGRRRASQRQGGIPMDVTRHQGKTAIVTGAGSGIGRATVLRLAQEGAQVVALDVNQKGLDASQAELETKGLKADFLRADVTSQDDIQRVVEAAGDQIDILANVAGIMDHFIPL